MVKLSTFWTTGTWRQYVQHHKWLTTAFTPPNVRLHSLIKEIFDDISCSKLMTIVPLVYQSVHVSLKRYMYPATIKEKLCLNVHSKWVTTVQVVFLVNKKLSEVSWIKQQDALSYCLSVSNLPIFQFDILMTKDAFFYSAWMVVKLHTIIIIMLPNSYMVTSLTTCTVKNAINSTCTYSHCK